MDTEKLSLADQNFIGNYLAHRHDEHVRFIHDSVDKTILTKDCYKIYKKCIANYKEVESLLEDIKNGVIYIGNKIDNDNVIDKDLFKQAFVLNNSQNYSDTHFTSFFYEFMEASAIFDAFLKSEEKATSNYAQKGDTSEGGGNKRSF
jgi:hypothetical protein